MKVRILYDQGSAQVAEDRIICRHPYYFGVTDGVTGVYLPTEGPRLFRGMTGGQLASDIICCVFNDAFPSLDSLENILRRANRVLRKEIEDNNLSIEQTELLPSAAFVVSEINEQEIRIIQGGDSLAVWQMKDGTLGGTSNKTYDYEKDLVDTITKLMKKHKKNRDRMWKEFRPYLIKKRRENINTSKCCVFIRKEDYILFLRLAEKQQIKKNLQVTKIIQKLLQ